MSREAVNGRSPSPIITLEEHDLLAKLLPLYRRLKMQVKHSGRNDAEKIVQIKLTKEYVYIDELVNRGRGDV